MLLYKSPDGQRITVVVGTCEQTMTIAEWSSLIVSPKNRAIAGTVVDGADRNDINHRPDPRPVRG